MFKQNSKYRLIYLTLGFLALAFGSAMAFLDYAGKNEGMRLYSGIVFGLMGIFFAVDIYGYIKNKKTL